MPFGPRCTAGVGMTTTCFSVSIRTRTLTNWPGHSCRLALGNSAFMRTVPVVGSTWLSTTCKRAAVERGLAVGVERLDASPAPLAIACVDLDQLLLRQREQDGDRLAPR